MKKIIMIIVIVFCCFLFMNICVSSQVLDNIKINIKEDQIGITFLNSDNTKGILINHHNKNYIILLEVLNQFYFRKEFFMFHNISIDYTFVLSEEDKRKVLYTNSEVLDDRLLEDIKLDKEEELISIEYFNKKFCIVNQPDIEVNTCDFIYISNNLLKMNISDTTKFVIYDTGVEDDIRMQNYNQWIDTIKLAPDFYFTFVWDENDYETITVPKRIS